MRRFSAEMMICCALLASVAALYGQTWNFEFVYGDPLHVVDNPAVSKGLTPDGRKNGFASTEINQWLPMARLAFLVDVALFGLDAGGHHLMNAGVHAVNAVLLFLLLRGMTGAVWPSGLAAAMFAVHPLHAENVAWISQRQDTLSTLFWLLAVWAYWRYTRCPKWSSYLVVVVCFLLGFTTKAMVVILPCTLLLLDYWPLDRVGPTASRRVVFRRLGWLLFEKLPLLLLSFAVGAWLLLGTKETGDMPAVSFTGRLCAMLVSHTSYLWKLVWPVHLGPWYPHPSIITENLPFDTAYRIQVLAGTTVFLFLSAAVFYLGRRHRYLVTGWLWYLMTLLPVSGMVFSQMYLADRNVYVPFIGMYLIVAWGARDLAAALPGGRWGLAAASTLALSACMFATWHQAGTWRDSDTLDEHVLRVTSNNYMTHYSLGVVYKQLDKLTIAKQHFQHAARIRPDDAHTANNLGVILLQQGDLEQSGEYFQQALASESARGEALKNLGTIQLRRGKLSEAAEYLEQALHIRPHDAEIQQNLGIVFSEQGELDKAVDWLRRALEIEPDSALVHFNLGRVLTRQGHLEQAASHLYSAIRRTPTFAEAHYVLGLVFQGQGNQQEATQAFERVVLLAPTHLVARNQLGNLYLGQGDLEKAARQFEAVLAADPENANAHINLGYVYLKQGHLRVAALQLEHALSLEPDHAGAHYRLGAVRQKQGRFKRATAEFRESITINAEHVPAINDLAWLLATCPDEKFRDGAAAVQLAKRADEATGRSHPKALDTLAAAYAEAGQFEEAISTAAKAVRLAEKQMPSEVKGFRQRLQMYQDGKPFRDRPEDETVKGTIPPQ